MSSGRPRDDVEIREILDPELVEAIGERPERYLDRDLTARGATRLEVERGPDGWPLPPWEVADGDDPVRIVPDRDVSTAWSFVEDRINGIDRFDVLDAWITVEIELGPRSKVIGALNRRKIELEENGTRSDHLERRREADVDDDELQEDDVDEPIVWRHLAEECGSTEVERLSRMAFQCDGCGKRVPSSRVEEVDS